MTSDTCETITPLPTVGSNTVLPMQSGAGERFVREGELSGRFYIITAGEVEVLQHVDGGERLIRRLHAGDYFGELALLGDRRRTATVRAVTDTSVLSIARQDFTALVEHLPALQGALTQPRPQTRTPPSE